MSAAPIIGTVYGYAVRSSLAFRYLRSGPGDALAIEPRDDPDAPAIDDDAQLLAEWDPTRATPWAGRIHSDRGSYRLWMGDVGTFIVDPASGTISVPSGIDPTLLEERLWGIPAMLCFLARGDLPLHAAAIEIDGRAVILAAPSAAGKTTIAAAAVSAGLRVLSEDVTCVRPGPVPTVIPGPAMLRIRPDVARWLDMHHAVRVEGGDDRVHVALDVDRRGDCAPVPLREIMLLRGARQTARWEPVARPRAIRDLWSVSSRIPTSSGRARCFEDLVDVVGRVPIGDLYRAEHDTDLAPLLDLIARHP